MATSGKSMISWCLLALKTFYVDHWLQPYDVYLKAQRNIGSFKHIVNRAKWSQGKVLPEKWVGVCFTASKTLALFKAKICDLPYPIYDMTKYLIFVRPRPASLEPEKPFLDTYEPIPFAAAHTRKARIRVYPRGNDYEASLFCCIFVLTCLALA